MALSKINIKPKKKLKKNKNKILGHEDLHDCAWSCDEQQYAFFLNCCLFILGFTSCILNNENKTLWYELYNELVVTQKCVACQLCIPVFE